MKKFLVSNEVGFKNDVNVGIAPGKFDTKQLILSALVVLYYLNQKEYVRFVRTIKKETLSKCCLFINDDFTTVFPQIPSFHDIEQTWNKTCRDIILRYTNYDEQNLNIIIESVKEKICDLEAIDCIMELYEVSSINEDSFGNALELTLKLIDKFISDSVKESMYSITIKSCINSNKYSDYVSFPLYVQDWRSILKSMDGQCDIKYAIFPENSAGTRIYIIESYDKDIVMKKYVKGMADICYSGRYFVKVTNIEAAKNVIARLPKSIHKHQTRFA